MIKNMIKDKKGNENSTQELIQLTYALCDVIRGALMSNLVIILIVNLIEQQLTKTSKNESQKLVLLNTKYIRSVNEGS